MRIMKVLLAVILFSASLFPLAAEAKTNFKDVTQDFWAKEDIDFLAENKIIFGYNNGNFGVGDNIRRSDAAMMIVRALGIETKNRPNPKFKDVNSKSYGYDVIAAVTDEKIFFGNNGEFKPNSTLTRAEMAAILTRAFQLTGKGVNVPFEDVPNNAWHYESVQALLANEITFGYADNTFRPADPITRAQFSAFLARAMKQMPQEEKLEVVKIY
ncbi:S-layer homology domain-containing protein [Bacillus benzoevorans]|uniref:SLH domain-containing protein n=1 Tax=Bacillus benzoevorans TaxID=1456 RepID=A0A7X0LUN6_9BACI|nr:S-layer homology domain-containing protein [Bacillus benzoevorans]MBB6445151.1 hypothetical protein [Bacillus benzoevorans]